MPDIDKIINDMTLEQKIGQMFMGNICGGETVELAKRNFEEFHFGGLQFSGVFERFIRGGNAIPCGVCKNEPLDVVAKFLHDIHRASLDILGTPVIVGCDQEGGVEHSIFRRREATIIPMQMGLGATGSPEDTYKAASIVAKEIKILGADMLYGPSLDVNTNPKNPEIGNRSFGEDPEAVAAHGEQVIRACNENNVIATAKHFPGRGEGGTDAHHELERIEVDRDRMDAVELLPFRRAVAAGVEAFMMAHTVFPTIESGGLPGSLSPAMFRVLREDLGFEGVIIPDSLSMFAISHNFELPRACAMCLEAGADMIFMKVQNTYPLAVAAITESIQAGRLTEERMHASIQRILKLKFAKGLFDPPAFSAEKVTSTVGSPEHVETVTGIGQRAVVVLKNADGVLPMGGEKIESLLAVVPRNVHISLSNDPGYSYGMLPGALKQHVADVRQTVVDADMNEFQSYEAVAMAKNVDAVVMSIDSPRPTDRQVALLDELVETGKPVIVVLTCPPYALAKLPDGVKAVVCTFGVAPTTFNAAADILFGKLKSTGTLPVAIDESMPRGWAGAAV